MKIASIADVAPAAHGYAEIRGSHVPVYGLDSLSLFNLSRKYWDLTAVIVELFSGGKPSGGKIVSEVVKHAPDAIPEILAIALQADKEVIARKNLSVGEAVDVLTIVFEQTFPESDGKKLKARFEALGAAQPGKNGTPSESSNKPSSTQSRT